MPMLLGLEVLFGSSLHARERVLRTRGVRKASARIQIDMGRGPSHLLVASIACFVQHGTIPTCPHANAHLMSSPLLRARRFC
jgi:hypothetical protein